MLPVNLVEGTEAEAEATAAAPTGMAAAPLGTASDLHEDKKPSQVQEMTQTDEHLHGCKFFTCKTVGHSNAGRCAILAGDVDLYMGCPLASDVSTDLLVKCCAQVLLGHPCQCEAVHSVAVPDHSNHFNWIVDCCAMNGPGGVGAIPTIFQTSPPVAQTHVQVHNEVQ